MNKKILIEKLNKKYPELGEPLVEKTNLFLRNVQRTLKRDYKFEIKNFGVFKLKKLDERKLLTPKTTGKYVEIASKICIL